MCACITFIVTDRLSFLNDHDHSDQPYHRPYHNPNIPCYLSRRNSSVLQLVTLPIPLSRFSRPKDLHVLEVQTLFGGRGVGSSVVPAEEGAKVDPACRGDRVGGTEDEVGEGCRFDAVVVYSI